jgi:hypothetical protein
MINKKTPPPEGAALAPCPFCGREPSNFGTAVGCSALRSECHMGAHTCHPSEWNRRAALATPGTPTLDLRRLRDWHLEVCGPTGPGCACPLKPLLEASGETQTAAAPAPDLEEAHRIASLMSLRVGIAAALGFLPPTDADGFWGHTALGPIHDDDLNDALIRRAALPVSPRPDLEGLEKEIVSAACLWHQVEANDHDDAPEESLREAVRAYMAAPVSPRTPAPLDLREAARQLAEAVTEYHEADGSILFARCLNACIGVERALAALPLGAPGKGMDEPKGPGMVEWCREERAKGNGGCGACALCCGELRQKVESLEAALLRQKDISRGYCNKAAKAEAQLRSQEGGNEAKAAAYREDQAAQAREKKEARGHAWVKRHVAALTKPCPVCKVKAGEMCYAVGQENTPGEWAHSERLAAGASQEGGAGA